MDKNELRIGNIVMFDDGSFDIVKVDGIYTSAENDFINWTKIDGLGRFDNGNSLLLDFDPIELTEDVLKKCGFKGVKGIEEECLSIKIDYIEISIHLENYHYFIDSPFNQFEGKRQIKYLHTLQNLVYAITGQEIKIHL
jgi:hypothetical protein